MKRIVFGMLAFAAAAMLVVSPVGSQPPGGKGGKQGGPPRFELGQVFPPPLLEELHLTPAQQKKFEAIKKDLKAKLEKLLTDEQKKTVEHFRPRGPGGPGGPGGRGGKGGPGEKGGKGGERPDRPPME